jgi:predicted GNAT family N-acyltransferase
VAESREAPKLVIEPLNPGHDRSAFACGIAALDSYLLRQARQDVRKRVAIAFVATPNGRIVAGFYTLSQFAVELDVIPREIASKLPKYPRVPATLIGRLAVSVGFQGQRVGELLLMDALHRSYTGSRLLASAGVVVDAKTSAAVGFYRKYGFLELAKESSRLFLPMGTIEKLFLPKWIAGKS